MLLLSVTTVGGWGALDSISNMAPDRRTDPRCESWRDLRVLSRVRRPDGRDEFSASCDTQVGRRWPRIPFTCRNKPLNRAVPLAGRGRSVMTAARVIVTDLSHLCVRLDDRGDFRGPVRFAVSSKPSRPARRCEPIVGGINVLRWVGGCGESCPLMSISPARGRTCGRSRPGGDGSPADRDVGVWQVGGVVQGGLLCAGHGARQAVSC